MLIQCKNEILVACPKFQNRTASEMPIRTVATKLIKEGNTQVKNIVEESLITLTIDLDHIGRCLSERNGLEREF